MVSTQAGSAAETLNGSRPSSGSSVGGIAVPSPPAPPPPSDVVWKGFRDLRWQVHKFGGTSVADASCFRSVAAIVLENLHAAQDIGGGDTDDPSSSTSSARLAVVVSAMGGKPKTTDLLLQSVRYAAERNDDQVEATLQIVHDKHMKCLADLFLESSSSSSYEQLRDSIEVDLHHIRDILKTVSLMMWPAQRILELVSGYGELWSTQILAHLLNQQVQQLQKPCRFVYVDARKVITIDEEAESGGEGMQIAEPEGGGSGGGSSSSGANKPAGAQAGSGVVVWHTSSQKLQQLYQEELESSFHTDQVHLVMTGYVACNTRGVATTLQRDGSDYSASILGRLLKAHKITIWTDVSGVLTADPRRVPLATVVPEISYNEAQELAYFGSKVIHPKTMQPAIQEEPQIPIYIRNTFEPNLPGTRIYLPDRNSTSSVTDKVVCGFSTVENMALVNVEGSGMMGVPGVATRIFATLKRNQINVVLISQASSEHSVTFCCIKDHAELAKRALEDEFRRELDTKRIESVDIRSPCSIIAAVGDGMALTSGVSGRFFSALGDAKINVHAIAQGSSERNISAVVWSHESTRALRAVHAAFSLSYSTVRVAILGMTAVGQSLLRLLETQRAVLRTNFDIDVQVCVVLPSGSSAQMVCLQKDKDASGVNTSTITMGSYKKLVRSLASETKDSSDSPHASFHDEATSGIIAGGGVDHVADRLFLHDCTTHVVFDCTNDETVSKYHASWLRSGIDVVTANNTGLSGPKPVRQEIKDAEQALGKQSAKYLRQVTVAGGLPVLSTLRSLLNSGDVIRRIDGVFTVVLSYVLFRISPPPDIASCSNFDMEFSNGAFGGDLSLGSDSPGSTATIGTPCTLSEAIREAIALGLTEDDPTTDLNNEYTARVLMVLARELGMDDDNDVKTIQQASDTLWDIGKTPGVASPLDLGQLLTPEMDQKVKDRVVSAQSRGCVLRSISSIDVKSKRIEIKLVEVPTHHVFAVTPPSCSCVRFFTKRHRAYPLIIQGPSAGADSTASALLAELLQRTKGLSNTRTLALSREGSGAFLNRLLSPTPTAAPAVSA